MAKSFPSPDYYVNAKKRVGSSTFLNNHPAS